jgi:hypothetical protein
MSKNKFFAGALLFIGILAFGFVLNNFINLYYGLPTKERVLDFAKTVSDDVPTIKESVTGVLLPKMSKDSGVVTDMNKDTPTNLAEVSTSSADWLTDTQRNVLKRLGIDEASLPKNLTPELESCLVSKIGQDRFIEIKAGDSPTLVEGMKAVACL